MILLSALNRLDGFISAGQIKVEEGILNLHAYGSFSTRTMKLTKQEQKVCDYIREHRGCTTRDIQRDLLIECPSARITGLRKKGVLVTTVGQKKKYPGARPFEMYAVEKVRKPKQIVEFLPNGNVRVSLQQA
jgi:Helix-turn-helix domain